MKREDRTTKSWAEAERFLDDFRGRMADAVQRLGDRALTIQGLSAKVQELEVAAAQPIPMLLHCPMCSARHIDEGEFATKVHTSHACQQCGHVWRPAIVATCGVQFLPGFKNVPPAKESA